MALKEPNYPDDDPQNMAGREKWIGTTPIKNTAPSLERPQYFQDFAYDQEAGMWHVGTIYDLENGKTYKC